MTADSLATVLREHGFRLTHDTDKIYEFTRASGEVVYLNRKSTSGSAVLRLHPARDDLAHLRLDGVRCDGERFHSNMGEFPTKLHTGEKPNHFGLAFTLSRPDAASALITALLSPATTPDVLDDLEAQDEQLATLTHTERQAIVKSRIGQGAFRDSLLDLWDSRCAVTGCAVPSLLVASHIKPWRDSTNQERLDVFNGLLLVPNLDLAFDRGLLTVARSGALVISPSLPDVEARRLGISSELRLSRVDPQHLPYLEYHRTAVFWQ